MVFRATIKYFTVFSAATQQIPIDMQDNRQINNCCFPNKIEPATYPNCLYSFLNEMNQVGSFKLFWLIASASSLGVTGLWQQSAQAGTTLLGAVPGSGETLIAELNSNNFNYKNTLTNRHNPNTVLDNKKDNVGDLNHISSNPQTSIPLSQPSFSSDLQRIIFNVPKLPPLAVNPIHSEKAPESIYTVRAGDTIISIALRHGVSSQQIIKANQLTNPNLIKVNRQLIIPSQKLTKGFARNVAFKKRKYSLNNNFISPELAPRTPLNFSKKPKSSRSFSQTQLATNSPKRTAASTNNDHYISKLRQDIVKLRSEYQQQFKGDLSRTALMSDPQDARSLPATTKIKLNPSQSTNSVNNSIEVLSSSERLTKPLIKATKNFALVPELPPLASPEEYLPNNSTFNGYMWPAQGNLTSGYGWRWGRLHKGIDIAAPIGTPIVAAAPGEVIFAGWNSGGYGNLVKLKHQDGSITLYAHNNRLLIRSGQHVKQGQLIAEMGSTGRSSGPHLHFEIRPNGSSAINPIARLPKR